MTNDSGSKRKKIKSPVRAAVAVFAVVIIALITLSVLRYEEINRIAVVDYQSVESDKTDSPSGVTDSEILQQVDWSKGARKIAKLERQGDDISSITFSKDGMYVLTGSDDGTAKLYTLSDWECIKTLDNTYHCDSAAFSPDGQFAITPGYHSAFVWSIPDCTFMASLDGHDDLVGSVDFSNDGLYVVTGSWDKTAILWSFLDGKRIKRLSGHSDDVVSTVFSPDSKFVLTGSRDDTAKLWTVPGGKCVRTLRGHKKGITQVAISPDGLYALTGSWDETARLWSIPDGKCKMTINAHKICVFTVAFSPDGKYILTGGGDSKARIWSLADGKCVSTLDLPGAVCSASFSPDGRFILCGNGEDGSTGYTPPEGYLPILFECAE